MIIHPHPIELDEADLIAATNDLTEFFNRLVFEFGGLDMWGWSIAFTTPALVHFGGQCVPDIKTVLINTVALARDIQNKRGLEYWRGLVIHEFAHAWGYENYRSGFLHTFPFHCVVSLLLARFGLEWDKRLYNLCDDQKGRYNYTPAVLFRLCRILARGVHNKDTLQKALERLLIHFDTRPKTLGQVRFLMRFEGKQWAAAYSEALEEKRESAKAARFWERACWFAVAAAGLLSLRLILV